MNMSRVGAILLFVSFVLTAVCVDCNLIRPLDRKNSNEQETEPTPLEESEVTNGETVPVVTAAKQCVPIGQYVRIFSLYSPIHRNFD